MVIAKIVSSIALGLLVTVIALLYDGIDRIVHARMQRRYGPPVIQTILDVGKLLIKENIVPRQAIPWLFNGAPVVALASTLIVFLYIPMGTLPPVLCMSGDLILIIYLFTLPAVALVIGAFASGSPWASVGAQREMVLMMSYEFPLAVVASTLAWLIYKSGFPGAPFSLETFVASNVWSLGGWMTKAGLLLLLLTMAAVIPAEVGKIPMDIPEAKTEIVEGLIVEYSGRNLALIKMTFALRTLAISCVITAMFFPFSLGKFLGFSGVFMGIIDFIWFWIKVLVIQLLGTTVIRTSFARLKIQQASWVYWVPVSITAVAGMLLIGLDKFLM